MTSSGHVALSAPLDTIPVHVRGGSIIALQEPNTTTTERFSYLFLFPFPLYEPHLNAAFHSSPSSFSPSYFFPSHSPFSLHHSFLSFLFCSRKNPFALLVALDDNQSGEGWLYWDDGETLATFETGAYSLLHFSVADVRLSAFIHAGHLTCSSITLPIINGSDQPIFLVFLPWHPSCH